MPENAVAGRQPLCERIEEKVLGEKSKKQQANEKIRRQKRRRSRRAKAKMLDEKAKQGTKKKLRGRIRPDALRWAGRQLWEVQGRASTLSACSAGPAGLAALRRCGSKPLSIVLRSIAGWTFI